LCTSLYLYVSRPYPSLLSFPTRRSSDLVVQLGSDLGIPSLVVADNGQSGPGAVLDLSALLHGGMLLPDSTSAPRQLVFRLTDLRSEEHTSELQSLRHLVCRLLLEKKHVR